MNISTSNFNESMNEQYITCICFNCERQRREREKFKTELNHYSMILPFANKRDNQTGKEIEIKWICRVILIIHFPSSSDALSHLNKCGSKSYFPFIFFNGNREIIRD